VFDIILFGEPWIHKALTVENKADLNTEPKKDRGINDVTKALSGKKADNA
jgi:hypothetical protein